jgi:phthiocerol/phenolphthiocerol synthesis type-I polyketide synthase D
VAAAFPEIHRLGFFANLVAELEAQNADDDWEGPEALRQMSPADALDIATARLRNRISAIMGYPDDGAIVTDQPLTAMGMDSLMAVRMRNTVRGDFGVEPPIALLLQGASLADLASELIRQLGLAEPEPQERHSAVRDRAQKRAAARQRAASRRKVDQRL